MQLRWIIIGAVLAGAPAGKAYASGMLDGVWVVKDATIKDTSQVLRAWASTLIVKDRTFELTHYVGGKVGWKGKFLTGMEGNPQKVDLEVEGIDLSEIWEGVNYPAARVRGIFEVKDGELRVCLGLGPKVGRPAKFESRDDGVLSATFVRARQGYTG